MATLASQEAGQTVSADVDAAAEAAERADAGTALNPGDVFRDCAGCPEMVVVPAGSFRMGCVLGQECRDNELPVRDVTIPRPFAVSKYEVTFEEWDACAGGGGCGGYHPDDRGWGRGARPVIHVSWHDAQAYVAWLSQRTGHEYRLLSEAEWEYVARAGTSTVRGWGDAIGSNRANCDNRHCGDEWEFTAPVGSFPANAFGVHDTLGNVMEWVEDCPTSYAVAPPDGSAVGDCEDVRVIRGPLRVLRGGSWLSGPQNLRAAFRGSDTAGYRGGTDGFRVARTLAP